MRSSSFPMRSARPAPYFELRGRLALLLMCLATGCATRLEERLVPCTQGGAAESAHSWGGIIAVRPASGHDWTDLLKEPFREYGAPPVNRPVLEQRYGVPTRTWAVKDRPFVEYLRPDGRLQLGLEEERSGSDAFRTWRLRLSPPETEIPAVLENQAAACIEVLERPDVDVNILSRTSGIPKVSMTVQAGKIREIVWLNLDRP